MARRRLEARHTRKLIKGTTSYLVTVPVEFIRELGWRASQKLVIDLDERRKEIVIRDWEK